MSYGLSRLTLTQNFSHPYCVYESSARAASAAFSLAFCTYVGVAITGGLGLALLVGAAACNSAANLIEETRNCRRILRHDYNAIAYSEDEDGYRKFVPVTASPALILSH